MGWCAALHFTTAKRQRNNEQAPRYKRRVCGGIVGCGALYWGGFQISIIPFPLLLVISSCRVTFSLFGIDGRDVPATYVRLPRTVMDETTQSIYRSIPSFSFHLILVFFPATCLTSFTVSAVVSIRATDISIDIRRVKTKAVNWVVPT